MKDPGAPDLRAWLQTLGLEAYVEAFAREEVTLEQLPDLTDQDLKDIGVSALGHRKRILKAAMEIEALDATSNGSITAQPQGPAAPPPRSTPTPLLTHPDAQRRQVTVMFCDLVGSTSLSTQMDPEDLRELIGRYHQHASREIKAAGGFVAKFMGDGVLAYFGYPQASENDAERAVRAGLAVVQGMEAVNLRGRADLQVRVGIATGTVVVGDLVVEGTAPERAVVGETPNLAARLQSLAEPGQVLIGVSTRRLLGELFELQDLGALAVKGFAQPVQAWQVLGQRAAASRFEAQRAGALSRFVGRDSEVAMLLERWELAADGEGQVVLVTGEAGIGKSRITAALRERVGQQHVQSPALVLLWQCSPLHSGTPLHPVVQQLQQAAIQSESGLETRLSQAGVPEATRGWVLRLAGAGEQGPTGLDPSVEKTNTLYAVVEALQALSTKQAVVLLVEDAHWIDPSTEELLGLAVQQLRAHRVLLVVTSRPGYEPAWQQAPNLTRLALSRLAQRQSLQLAQEVASEVARSVMGQWSLPKELLEQIVKRTDGVPLFVEELTKAVLEAGLPQELQQGWQGEGIAKLAIPTTLQDSLTARLDRLQPGTREVAQAASVIGREFSQALLREALKPMGEAQVVQALQELQRAELVYLRHGAQAVAGGGTGNASGAGNTAPAGAGGTGSFKHALVRDAAYGSLLKAQRAQWHAKVARALEAVQPQVVQQQPELLAGHRQQAGELEAALALWRQAGDRSASEAAFQEAAGHYRAALRLIEAQDATPQRDVSELKLLMRLSTMLAQTEGFGSSLMQDCFSRARSLASKLNDIETFVAASSAIGGVLMAKGRPHEVEPLFEAISIEQLARVSLRNRLTREAILALAAKHLGDQRRAWPMMQAARAGLVGEWPNASRTPGLLFRTINLLVSAAYLSLLMGRMEEADSLSRDTVLRAEETADRAATTYALSSRAMVLTDMGLPAEARVLADRSAEMARSRGLRPWATLSGIAQGLIMVDLGEVNEGLSWFQEHLNAWEREQGAFHCGEFCGLMANRLLGAGWTQQAFDLVLHVQELYRDLSERMYAAELLRLRSRFRELDGDLDGAEAGYGQALALATHQGADRLALRAAESLGRLWLARGEPGLRILELVLPLLDASMIPRSHAEWLSVRALVEQASGG